MPVSRRDFINACPDLVAHSYSSAPENAPYLLEDLLDLRVGDAKALRYTVATARTRVAD